MDPLNGRNFYKLSRLLLVLVSLFCLTCDKHQQKAQTLAKAPRFLVAQKTQKGINTGSAVAGITSGPMEVVSFISPTQTKEPIIAAINSDDGPEGTSGKTYIRIWYVDAHAADDAEHPGKFVGPWIGGQDSDHISPDDISLPAGHPGYVLVFFNACHSIDNYEAWMGKLKATYYLGWNEDTPGVADKVGLAFAQGVVDYFTELESENPPTQDIGPYVYEKIIKYSRKGVFNPEEHLRQHLILKKAGD